MPVKPKTIADRLANASTAINNTLSSPDLLALLAEFGYNEERLKEGLFLQRQAEKAHDTQRTEYGEQYAASEAVNAGQAIAEKQARRILKIARIALKADAEAARKLKLFAKKERRTIAWIDQTKALHDGFLADAAILAKLGRFGLTDEKIKACRRGVATLEQLTQQHTKETGDAQQATKNRDEALEKLDEWMADFIGIARIALEDTPQLIEKLGIFERS